jgi:HprK-related kinase A
VKVGDVPPGDLRALLGGSGATIRTGPFVIHLRTPLEAVASAVHLLYADFPLEQDQVVADFHVALEPPPGLRRWIRPQVVFHHDGAPVFQPFPVRFAIPLLEWGLNWCCSTHGHRYLMLHAAVVERDGRAVVMPGPAGSGKSTLCAALVHAGWRLLSDELAIFRPEDGYLVALPRPVSLKARAIHIMRDLAPAAVFGPAVRDTHKGTIAHMRPPSDSVARAQEPARPAWIVFPRYDASVAAVLRPASKATSMLELVANAFNYGVHGAAGFEALAGVVDGSECYELAYGDLAEATASLAAVTSGSASSR